MKVESRVRVRTNDSGDNDPVEPGAFGGLRPEDVCVDNLTVEIPKLQRTRRFCKNRGDAQGVPS